MAQIRRRVAQAATPTADCKDSDDDARSTRLADCRAFAGLDLTESVTNLRTNRSPVARNKPKASREDSGDDARSSKLADRPDVFGSATSANPHDQCDQRFKFFARSASSHGFAT